MFDVFADALDALALPPGAGIALAYSGGIDSSVLLDLAAAAARGRGLQFHAFHIHHGLSPNADAWLAHCEQTCAARGIAFAARRIALAPSGNGVEEAARLQRYAALGDLCREHGVGWLLTAHHQDDQAETVLLQLLRGSGVAGLSGMDAANEAPSLLGGAGLIMARPLLHVARAEIESYARTHAIAHIDDESNSDARYARNAVRLQVMPLLAQLFPGFQQRFARSAGHAQSAQRLLVELGKQDLRQCLQGECLDIGEIRKLDADRIDNLLRYWFGERGLRMPSSAWLAELRTQLLEAKADAQLCVTHPDCHIRRHRDRVFLTPRYSLGPRGEPRRAVGETPDEKPVQAFAWAGEASIAFADFGGVLHFDPAGADETGIGAAWLREQSLFIRLRSGGERLKLAPNRPTKSVKYHYQAMDIPSWERPVLPIVGVAPDKLLFAAGIGMDCAHQQAAGERVRLRWRFD
ncbi:tRNA lysidine(34) synthetase TilS [Oxalobacteraceae bacterium CAVE-383]|nr:tRNA lysidine(34) synthetase TilS [Oxalobacteraceae bacterium CAVE-383]